MNVIGNPVEEYGNMENPLLNHLVVSKLLSFGNLNFEDLKNFRAVCSLWYTVSLDQWRESVTINLVESYNNDIYGEKSGVSIESLCQLYKHDVYKLSRKPYRKYQLKGWSSQCPNVDNHSSINAAEQDENLWTNVVAPSVESLHIEGCYFPDSKQLEHLVLACESLKELLLIGNSYGICRGYPIKSDEFPRLTCLHALTVNGCMPMQWSKLLLHTPNLESLTIKQNGSYNRATFASFLLDLHQLEYCGRNPMNIKHLDIMEADDTFMDFVSLSSRNLRLESLSIHFEKIRPEHFMQPLLRAQARTLKILKLCRVSNRLEETFGTFEFPYSVHMPCLKELHIWGNVVKSLNFLGNMPRLQNLFVSRDRFDKRHLIKQWRCERRMSNNNSEPVPQDLMVVEVQNEIPGGDIVMQGMEELHVDCQFAPESFIVLRRWMPSLKTIHTMVNNDTLEVICKEWPQLKNLQILHGSQVDGKGLRNLYQMKYLERFTFDAYCNETKVSTTDIQDLLGRANKLKYLKACVFDEMVAAKEVELRFKRINKQVDVELISNSAMVTSHSHYDCCERVKFRSQESI